MDEVCGCPLVKNVFELTGEFCRVSKRKCNKHYNWEKLRRAEVDLERVRVVSRCRRTSFHFKSNRIREVRWSEKSLRHLIIFLVHSGTSWMNFLSRSVTSEPPWPTEQVFLPWCCTKLFSTTHWRLISVATKIDNWFALVYSIIFHHQVSRITNTKKYKLNCYPKQVFWEFCLIHFKL